MSPYSKGASLSALPTRKWWAATVVAAGTVGTDWALAGHWSRTLSVAAVGLVVQRAVAYLIPNKEDE